MRVRTKSQLLFETVNEPGLASPGISLMEGVTVKFADVETAGFDVGDECAYRDLGR